uniref:Uncharacterized protein n=1 Tax=Meloidogyne incognita TaxID=6306 RepID=A0A914KJ09_MELIC
MKAWENIKIQLDDEIVFCLLDKQKSFMLGNIRTNSDIFVGGIPKENILLISFLFSQIY